VLLALALLLAVNTYFEDRDTKPARADIGRIVALPGGDLQVREDGPASAPDVVLIHGFASSMHWWTPVASRLAKRFHVIRIDLLGHGGSEKPRHGYSMTNQARLAALVLHSVGAHDAIVVGHSLGGVVATALAERDPRLVKAVGVVDSPPNKDAGELPFTARLGFVPVLGEALRRVIPDSVVRDSLGSEFASGFHVPDQFVHDFRRMTYTSYDDSHGESDDYSEAKPLSARLAAIHKPLLVIFGTKDELVPPKNAREYSSVPGARVEYVVGAGHSPMVEKPDQVATLIESFAKAAGR
jgi:pimeloyl-ACP methyl ester carboxylesterase